MTTQQSMPVERRAKYTFTENEKKLIGAELASKLDKLDVLKQEMKDAVSGFKERIESENSDIRKLTSNLNTGYEIRFYTCRMTKLFSVKKKQYREISTNKLIEEVDFDTHDHQMEFKDIEEANKKEAEEKKNKLDDKKAKKSLDIKPTLGQGVDLTTKAEKKKKVEKALVKVADKFLKDNGVDKKGQTK